MLLSRQANRAASLARTAANPRPTSSLPTARTLATARPRPRTASGPPWGLVGAVTGAALATATLYSFKPEWIPSSASSRPPPLHIALTPPRSDPPLAAQPLHADAPPPTGVHLDPTTKTPFPSRLTSPNGVPLRLVGTGVRTVSFLSVKVYAVAFYVSEHEFALAQQGKIAGWEGFTPERLIPPYNMPPDTVDRPVGEELVESLLEKADAAVVISASPASLFHEL